MNPAELLVLLTARTNKFERMPTGVPLLTQQDIAAALGRIQHRIASLLLRVKYAHQYDFMMELDRLIWLKVVDLWMERGWPYPKHKIGQEFRRDMGRMALAETIWPHTCPWCQGVGSMTIQRRRLRGRKRKQIGAVVMCDGCKGKGIRKPSDRQRAKLMGMPYTTWIHTWSPVYREVQTLIDQVESVGLGAIKKRLRD